jgi:hypothetical protein
MLVRYPPTVIADSPSLLGGSESLDPIPSQTLATYCAGVCASQVTIIFGKKTKETHLWTILLKTFSPALFCVATALLPPANQCPLTLPGQ